MAVAKTPDAYTSPPLLLRGFDTNIDCTKYLPSMKAMGYSFAMRYYRRGGGGIQRPEVKAISDAGMSLGVVFQYLSDTPAYFTTTNAAIDVQAALAKAEHLLQPEGSTIYFAVDCDAEPRILRPYFSWIFEAMIDTPWCIGVYGSGAVGDFLLDAGLVDMIWLAGSTGYRGSKGYQGWHIKQYAPQRTLSNGLHIDDNDAIGVEEAGLWSYG